MGRTSISEFLPFYLYNGDNVHLTSILHNCGKTKALNIYEAEHHKFNYINLITTK